ncbi:hypothetical protein LB507_008996 [Fusarium sp. FIESC RH6]|nr:hypothetical protein LB507_008996 [Fusarium sp. FIESC RH6]
MSYNQFPNRRRVIQACVNCRMRKTRCDAAQPKCGLCTTQNVDCVYRDARQPKIDYNTQVLLERMQLLEDRLLSTSRNNSSQTHDSGIDHSTVAEQQSDSLPEPTPTSQEPVFEVQIPLSHTANANHVFSWRLVQELLSEAREDGYDMQAHSDATDIFFHHQPHPPTTSHPPSSWKLFDDKTLSFYDSSSDASSQLSELIHIYFGNVNIFFPLLFKSDIIKTFNAVAAREVYGKEEISNVDMPHYGLLLVVLCLALLSASGQSDIRLTREDGSHCSLSKTVKGEDGLRYHLWAKARLVLGYTATDMSLATAQSSMLASIYMGACGLVAEAYHWAHATAVKFQDKTIELRILASQDLGRSVVASFSYLSKPARVPLDHFLARRLYDRNRVNISSKSPIPNGAHSRFTDWK